MKAPPLLSPSRISPSPKTNIHTEADDVRLDFGP